MSMHRACCCGTEPMGQYVILRECGASNLNDLYDVPVTEFAFSLSVNDVLKRFTGRAEENECFEVVGFEDSISYSTFTDSAHPFPTVSWHKISEPCCESECCHIPDKVQVTLAGLTSTCTTCINTIGGYSYKFLGGGSPLGGTFNLARRLTGQCALDDPGLVLHYTGSFTTSITVDKHCNDTPDTPNLILRVDVCLGQFHATSEYCNNYHRVFSVRANLSNTLVFTSGSFADPGLASPTFSIGEVIATQPQYHPCDACDLTGCYSPGLALQYVWNRASTGTATVDALIYDNSDPVFACD